MVIPGGVVGGDFAEEYSRRVRFVLDYAKNANSHGRKFFVLAVCKGMEEALAALAGSSDFIKCDFDDKNKLHTVNLDFESITKTAVLSKLDSDSLSYALQRNEVYFYHGCGVSPEDLLQSEVGKDFRMVGTSMTAKGKQFVSIVEHR